MLAIELRFPAGRYHATPAGHHVNEAAVAWPPDPWRFSRALIATWHLKADRDQYPRDQLDALLRQLNTELPHYALPDGVHAHTRHYMPARGGKTNLVFDAFARIDPDQPLTIVWPQLQLGAEKQQLLDHLLPRIGYLGRAESWVEAGRVTDWQGQTNCSPGLPGTDPDSGERSGEAIRLQAPVTPADYLALREQALQPVNGKRPGKKLKDSLPPDWLSALETDSATLHAARWNAPPAVREIAYQRPFQVLRSDSPLPPPRRAGPRGKLTTARFALYGKPLARVEDSLPAAEQLRRALTGLARKGLGEDHIPVLLSGHGMQRDPRHRHAFFLPEDSDGDNRIDHLLIHIPGGIDADIRHLLEHFTLVRLRGGRTWRVLLEGIADAADFRVISPLFGISRQWISATPYLRPWYRKKGFDYREQILRECQLRGLPRPSDIELMQHQQHNGRQLRPSQFQRFRRGKIQRQPDQRGSFARLHFDQPVPGPLALGAACHFGLGLFRPE
jgi:CRISPR-associated protein Csb2